MRKMPSRLRAERKKLGLSQKEFAVKAGVSAKTQTLYENGRRLPDARYLNLIAKEGVDILYVVTGTRSELFLSTAEADLLFCLRRLDDHVPRALTEFMSRLR
ncbi:helix-turn-helix transcriptional regulator [Caballeronia sp. ATUFL_F1_KS4A]|uniref:helix-turn-helix domain-containing protein n=1 Tax=Caballeronia sp. ATUFL_F1_KS4A TaxID=2921768 RepID=UPI0032EAED07